jgi:hypothetical protein
MAGQESFDSLSREELIRITLEQQKLIEQPRAEIEQLKRRGSAGRFPKGSSSKSETSWRQPGHGPFLRREAPTVAPDQPVIPVVVRERCCPDCGGELGEEKQEIVSITDIPVQPEGGSAVVRGRSATLSAVWESGTGTAGGSSRGPARGDSAPLGAAGEGAGARSALPARGAGAEGAGGDRGG